MTHGIHISGCSALGDVSKARIFYFKDILKKSGGCTEYAVWLALPKGVRAAFRAAGDHRPVYGHDYVDRG